MSSDESATVEVPASKQPSDFTINRFYVDLDTGAVRNERAQCQDVEDVFGGAARGYKLLADCAVDDAYDPAATLILNLGLLSGTAFMTGLRTFFHAYSPLKTGSSGKPGAMWTAGSGKFGVKLRALGIDEVIFTGRLENASYLRLAADESAPGGVAFSFHDASGLVGKHVNDKIQTLYAEFPNAHFAVLGPGGENYASVRYAAIALSTANQLKSGDPKPRFCGRGGIGGVMGSKNLLGIVADVADPRPTPQHPAMKAINMEVARGKGSARFRDKKKDGGGGTWANYEGLNPVHAMPEMNFVPTGTEISFPLWRDRVEAEQPFVVKDEACYRCGIRCHKNVYDKNEDGKAGKFRAKLDFEPLNLLASNIGIFDLDQACTLVELVDEMGMDSVSCGVSLSYAMEYNKRHPDTPIAHGLSYGDFEMAHRVVEEIGTGQLGILGQGCKRASEGLGDTGYAMHCKGMELPAYLPHHNPGYPFALAGGHMSMRTYLIYLYERETSVDYWVDAITNRGPKIMRDDLLGVCKFCAIGDEQMVTAIRALTELDIDAATLSATVMRTFLRGYKIERDQGFSDDDYSLPKESHVDHEQIGLPYFNTEEFFGEVQKAVIGRFDAMVAEAGF